MIKIKEYGDWRYSFNPNYNLYMGYNKVTKKTLFRHKGEGEEYLEPFKDETGYWKIKTHYMKVKSDPLQRTKDRTQSVHRLIAFQFKHDDYERVYKQIEREIELGIQPPLRKAGEWGSNKTETILDRIQVHHIDHDINNNTPENLEIMIGREHRTLHRGLK